MFIDQKTRVLNQISLLAHDMKLVHDELASHRIGEDTFLSWGRIIDTLRDMKIDAEDTATMVETLRTLAKDKMDEIR